MSCRTPTWRTSSSASDVSDAPDLVGRRVLVGVTWFDAGGEVVEQVERVGVVEATDGQVVDIRQDDGELFNVPADGFEPAVEGAAYRLPSGEDVTGVEFVATFQVRAAGGGADAT